MKLYRVTDAGDKERKIQITAISLYCDLSLKLLSNQYFDALKELIELEIALYGDDPRHLLNLFLNLKRISSSSATEYSEKLLDLTESALSRVNKPLSD